MDARTLDRAREVVDYIAFMITEFSLKHGISMKQSFNYLYEHGAIEFLDEFYDVEHCENPNITLRVIQDICIKNGGTIIA
ncbi:MAG: DUF3791 domain-containing protein [Tannerella sp.]|jgi:hypothetical protein|nr:DUF3791 domain-containing protein [Tannerella sp.]